MRSPISGRTCASARGSTSSRRTSSSAISTPCRRASCDSLEALFDAGCYVGHRDARRLAARGGEADRRRAVALARRVRVPDAARRAAELGNALVAEGHRLRIYVPFGSYWYEYSLRRLQENPSIAGYIASDTIGRVLHPRRNGSHEAPRARAPGGAARARRLRIVVRRTTSRSTAAPARIRTRTCTRLAVSWSERR